MLDGAAVLWTGRTEGDLAVAQGGTAAVTSARLAGLAGRPVSWLNQVHGNGVVVVAADDREPDRDKDGDALVTSGGTALAVMTADCAPLALSSPEGVVGAVHAGWRGLVAGVVQAAIAAMRGLGAGRVDAALGPCIHSECYLFGAAELEEVASRLGNSVRSEVSGGRPALDLRAGVAVALAEADARLVHDVDECTACAGDRYFSYRARGERERQAMIVWKR